MSDDTGILFNPLHALSVLSVIISILIFIFVIRCCLEMRQTPKVRRGRFLNQQATVSNTVAPTLHQQSTIDDDEFVLTPRTRLNAAGANVTVTSQTFTATPVVVPPYPIEPRHPTPVANPTGIGFAAHNPPYPTQNPHPIGAAPYYYPPPLGVAPYAPATSGAPYPPAVPAPYPDYSAQPPSYTEAISQRPVRPPTQEGYAKQAPYNPDY